MSEQNMKSSDIRIVCRCIDYMLMHDTQGELKKETERNVPLFLQTSDI